jgi:hypothetical protein
MSETRSEPTAGAAGSLPAVPKRFALPWDLSEWVSRDQLWQWTLEEVARLGWDQPELVAHLRNHPDYQPRLLLCQVGFAYCIGVFEDGEVADLGLADPRVRRLASAHAPSGRAVRNFRKANRGLIKWVLVELFRRVLRTRFELGGALLPAGLKRYLVRAASARLDLARTMIRATEEA